MHVYMKIFMYIRIYVSMYACMYVQTLHARSFSFNFLQQMKCIHKSVYTPGVIRHRTSWKIHYNRQQELKYNFKKSLQDLHEMKGLIQIIKKRLFTIYTTIKNQFILLRIKIFKCIKICHDFTFGWHLAMKLFKNLFLYWYTIMNISKHMYNLYLLL